MITKDRITTFPNSNRLSSLHILMVLSGLYVVFYILISLLWMPSDLHYWFMFPLFLYSGTYWTVISAGFLFAFCGVILIIKSNHGSLKHPLVMSWSILSAFVLLAMIGCLLSSNGVRHLDSADYNEHTIHLAFKNSNEVVGRYYYLVDCDHHDFQCRMVARFFPHNLVTWYGDAELSTLYISENGLVTVTAYNRQVIYEYSILSE